MVQPPPITSPSSVSIDDIARKVLLSHAEVSMWFERLQTVSDNRKRGLLKQLKHGEKNHRQVKRAPGPRLSTIVVFAKSLVWISQVRLKSGLAANNVTLDFILCVGLVREPEILILWKLSRVGCYLFYVCCAWILWYLQEELTDHELQISAPSTDLPTKRYYCTVHFLLFFVVFM